jgi:hypothetical protein
MTQRDLNRAVSRATGESLHTISQLGFVPLTPMPIERESRCIDWDLLDLHRNVPLLETLRPTPIAV